MAVETNVCFAVGPSRGRPVGAKVAGGRLLSEGVVTLPVELFTLLPIPANGEALRGDGDIPREEACTCLLMTRMRDGSSGAGRGVTVVGGVVVVDG